MNKKARAMMTSFFLFTIILIGGIYFIPSSTGADLTGLISYYRMDDSAANTIVEDIHGTNTGASATNTNVISTAGKINTAFDYSGSGDYVQIDGALPASNPQTWTTSFWFIDDGNVNDAEFFSMGQSSGATDFILFRINANNIEFRSRNGGGAATEIDTTYNPDTNWHFVIVNVDSGSVEIFVDDVSIGSGSLQAGTFNLNQMTIGAFRFSIIANFYDGTIDEFSIWDRSLSSAEMTELYNSGDGLAYPFGGPRLLLSVNLTSPLNDSSSTHLTQTFKYVPITSLSFNKSELWIANKTSGVLGLASGIQITTQGTARMKKPHLEYVNDSSPGKALIIPQIGDSATYIGGVWYCESNSSKDTFFNDCIRIISHNGGSFKRGTPSVAIKDLDNDGYVDVVAGMEANFISVVYGNSSNAPPFNKQVNSSSMSGGSETDYVAVGKSSSDTLYDIFVLAETPEIWHLVANNSKTGLKYDTAVSIGGLSGVDAAGIFTAYVSNDTRVDVFAMSETGYIYRCGYNSSQANNYNTCTVIAQTKYDMNNLVTGFGEGTGFEATNKTHDINGDNIPDIFFANNNESFIILSNISESDYYNDKIILKEDWTEVAWLHGADSIDWNKDGLVDWLVLDYWGELWVFIQNQSESNYFNEPVIIEGIEITFNMVVDDVTENNLLDIITTGNFTSAPLRGAALYKHQEIITWGNWRNVSSNSSTILNNTNNTIEYTFGQIGNYTWNIKIFDNESNSAFATINYTLELIEPPLDTCTYTSGDWAVDCADNCLITSEVDLGSNSISIIGTGTFTTTVNIINYINVYIKGTDASNICIVTCKDGGCFK